jgi:uncharacterized protein (DUF2062 family)
MNWIYSGGNLGNFILNHRVAELHYFRNITFETWLSVDWHPFLKLQLFQSCFLGVQVSKGVRKLTSNLLSRFKKLGTDVALSKF